MPLSYHGISHECVVVTTSPASFTSVVSLAFQKTCWLHPTFLVFTEL